MINLRGVSKTVSSGGRPLTILHPLDPGREGRPAARHRRSVRQRQVDADRPDGRPRQPSTGEILIDGTDITKARARTRWRASAAAPSASSSSSSTWCRR
jgi:hypothetical protein